LEFRDLATVTTNFDDCMTDSIDEADQFQNYVDNKIYGPDGWKLFRSYYNDYSFFDYSFYPCN
jgi:hypothetical protein